MSHRQMLIKKTPLAMLEYHRHKHVIKDFKKKNMLLSALKREI